MDVRMLRYVLEIYRTKNLTKAAANLYISQPALSKAIKKLEGELGMALFYREGSSLLPTDAAEIILERADGILDDFAVIDASLQDLKSLKRGRVSLGLPSIVALMYFPPILTAFREKYPGIDIKTFEYGGRELEERISAGLVDVAVSMRPIRAEGLNEIPIILDKMVAAMNRNHPLAGKTAITMQDLKDRPINTFTEEFSAHRQLMEWYLEAGVTPVTDILSPTCNFLVEMTKRNGEVCVLPGPTIRYFNHEGLVLIPFEPNFPWELCIVFRKNAYMSGATKLLISHIQGAFSASENKK